VEEIPGVGKILGPIVDEVGGSILDWIGSLF
jgi:hypothetical protein